MEVAQLELPARRLAREQEAERIARTLAWSSGWVRSTTRGAEQLLGRAPEDLHQRVVHAEELAVERHQRHADRRVLERAAEPLLCFSQFAFGVPAVGEVARADHDARDRTGRGPGWWLTASTIRQPPSAWCMPELDAVGALDPTSRQVERCCAMLAVVGVDQIERVRADERRRCRGRGCARSPGSRTRAGRRRRRSP